MTIKAVGPWFKDEHGRALLLRGVNLGGTTKLPTRPNGATYRLEGFFDHKNVSFVGRPFPLDEADEHFTRLKTWGLTFLRFLVTWEAIEHAGPGIYDTEYLDYVQAVVEKAAEYDMHMFIDPHQDVWSRFSGGDGAPGWTFDLIGMDITRFMETGAAVVHQTHGDPFPRMIWPTNKEKLAAATMFTLFFGGNDFAPDLKIDGVPIQDYLQDHYINAIKQVAMRVKGMPHVVGYDSLNEPFGGYIGWKDLDEYAGLQRIQACPTGFQTMALGSGFAQEVAYSSSPIPMFDTGETRVIDPEGVSVWKEGYECVWKQHGVWDIDPEGHPRLLRPHYFATVDGQRIDFTQDYLRPFINRFAAAIREVHSEALVFIESDYGQPPPEMGPDDADSLVYAPHWYDGSTLFLKRYMPYFGVDSHTNQPVIGPGNVEKSFIEQTGRYKTWSSEKLNDVPVLIGEIGIPYDMHEKRAYSTGDFSKQIEAMDMNMRLMDANLLNFTIWNYTPDNSNSRGDLWNDEDLSIFSPDQQTDPTDINSGGRALEAVVRPYAKATAGQPLRQSYDYHNGVFEFTFRHDPDVDAPTVFFVPNIAFPHGYLVEVSDGRYETDRENQTLTYYHEPRAVPHRVRIETLKPPEPESEFPRWLVISVVVFVLWLILRRKNDQD